MKILGTFALTSPDLFGIRQNVHDFSIMRGKWRCDFEPGLITNGATIPKCIAWAFGGRLNKDFDLSAFVHDQLVGEFKSPLAVYHIDTKEMRVLTWKEASAWFYDLLRCEDRKSNGKVRRKLFYHAVMSKKRLGLKK